MNITQVIETFDAQVDVLLAWLQDHGGSVFNAARAVLDSLFNAAHYVLSGTDVWVLCAVTATLGLRLVGWRFGVLAGAGLVVCNVLGMWAISMASLSLVVASTALALAIALPLGVMLGYSPRLNQLAEPFLDMLQTLPSYIYLLPAIALLGYGPATALISTVLVAVPPALRLTALGIRMTPIEFIELGKANGVSPLQMFLKIRVPFAIPSIMTGVNQSLMMAFSMVVIAGIVGSGGLGQTIYEAIRTLNIAVSIDATIVIVILTMILDRFTQSASTKKIGAAQ